MSVRQSDGILYLVGICPVEDAGTLLELIHATRRAQVDLGECNRMHMAVAQVLLAARPDVCRLPADPFLRDWLMPLLRQDAARNTAFDS